MVGLHKRVEQSFMIHFRQSELEGFIRWVFPIDDITVYYRVPEEDGFVEEAVGRVIFGIAR